MQLTKEFTKPKIAPVPRIMHDVESSVNLQEEKKQTFEDEIVTQPELIADVSIDVLKKLATVVPAKTKGEKASTL